MTVKSFGTILIGAGIFIIFTLFVFSSWRIDFDFMANLRYATLFEIGGSNRNSSNESIRITLGQGLLLPFLIIGIGLIIKYELVSSKDIIKILPFLTSNDDK